MSDRHLPVWPAGGLADVSCPNCGAQGTLRLHPGQYNPVCTDCRMCISGEELRRSYRARDWTDDFTDLAIAVHDARKRRDRATGQT